jgi:hypothetical protein
MLSGKISKALWYFKEPSLPRTEAPSYLNFCVHTERLHDNSVFDALLAFAADFNRLTGSRVAVCLSTPACPMTEGALAESGFCEDEFAQRVLAIREYADIGYHGHFCRQGLCVPDQISPDNYDRDVVLKQIDAEMRWFEGLDIRPKIYIAGWWFLTEDIVSELEARGIEVDLSVRKGRPNTFGTSYLDDDEVPEYGRPFILPPSKNIVEIQSIFGPVMDRRVMKGHLARYLKEAAWEEAFFIFPLHDWDIPKYRRNIWANVLELEKFKDRIDWMDILKMRDRYLERGLIKK